MAVASIAIGIAVNTTIFGAINAVLLRPLPYPHSDRLVVVLNNALRQRRATFGFSLADLFHWRKHGSVLEQVEITSWGAEPNALSGAGTPERVRVQYVTPGLFRLLGVAPFIGRVLSEDEQRRAKDYDGAAISYEFWQRHFGGDPKVLGRSTVRSSSVIGGEHKPSIVCTESDPWRRCRL